MTKHASTKYKVKCAHRGCGEYIDVIDHNYEKMTIQKVYCPEHKNRRQYYGDIKIEAYENGR